MLCQERVQRQFDGLPQFGSIESHAGSKNKNRRLAGRVHERRLHQGKPADIPQAGEGNSLRGAVYAAESTVQKARNREEEPGLIAVLI